MVMLVSLEQASEHLRRDNTDDDADLTLKIKGISSAIMNYMAETAVATAIIADLDSDGEIPVDSAGDPIGVPEELQIATLIMIGVVYADRDAENYREGGSIERLGKMSLPAAVHWILDPLRTPRLK